MFPQDSISLISVLILAVLPSLVWLFFYLKEDPHPEPRYWLFIIFLMGVALAPLVISLEMTLNKIFNFFIFFSLESGLLMFIIAPLVEETAKYGMVHLALNKNPVLDEPVDQGRFAHSPPSINGHSLGSSHFPERFEPLKIMSPTDKFPHRE